MGAKKSAGARAERRAPGDWPSWRPSSLFSCRVPWPATSCSLDCELCCRNDANGASDSTIGETLRQSLTGLVQAARPRCCLVVCRRRMGF